MQQPNICPNCGSALRYGQSFYQLHGTQITIGCPYCRGAAISPGARISPTCGTSPTQGNAPQPNWNTQQPGWGAQHPGWGRQQPSWWQQPGWGTPSAGSPPLSTRTLLLIVFLVLIIGLCSFVFLQFGVKSDKSLPTISEVSVVFRGKTSAQIVWQTDKPCSSQVEYGRTTQYGSLSPTTPQNDPSTKSIGVTTHNISLSNLKDGATYHYRVRSKDSAGNEAVSSDFSFKTDEAAPFVVPD
jgi:hypothetical protein